MKKRNLILLLLGLPFLMGNSPAPFTQPESDYTDFEISEIAKVDNFYAQAKVTNTGTGFIDVYNSHFKSEDNIFSNDYSYNYNDLIGPNKSMVVKFYTYDVSDLSNIEYLASGYTDPVYEGIEVSGFCLREKNATSIYEDSVETKEFTYHFEYSINIPSVDFDYVVVFEIGCGEETHYIYSRNHSGYLGFSTRQDYTNDDFALKSVCLAKGLRYSYNSNTDGFTLSAIFEIFLHVILCIVILISPFGIFFALSSGEFMLTIYFIISAVAILTAAIIILVSCIKKHKQNKKDGIDNKRNKNIKNVKVKKSVKIDAKNKASKVSKKHK